jgi:hypothetical protein
MVGTGAGGADRQGPGIGTERVRHLCQCSLCCTTTLRGELGHCVRPFGHRNPLVDRRDLALPDEDAEVARRVARGCRPPDESEQAGLGTRSIVQTSRSDLSGVLALAPTR